MLPSRAATVPPSQMHRSRTTLTLALASKPSTRRRSGTTFALPITRTQLCCWSHTIASPTMARQSSFAVRTALDRPTRTRHLIAEGAASRMVSRSCVPTRWCAALHLRGCLLRLLPHQLRRPLLRLLKPQRRPRLAAANQPTSSSKRGSGNSKLSWHWRGGATFCWRN